MFHNLRVNNLHIMQPVQESIATFNKSIVSFWLSICITQACLMRLYFSNIYFMDDIPRAFFGYGWDTVCRPFSTLTMQALSGGSFIHDLSPFTQITGSMIVTLSAHMLSLSFLRNEARNFFRITFTLLISLNPYILEMYSFRYDSLPYSLGFFFAVSAYLFLFELGNNFNTRTAIIGYTGTAICLCIATLYYQPAISIFLVVGFFRLFILGLSEPLCNKLKKLTAIFLLCIIISLLIAKIAQKLLITDASWTTMQSKLTLNYLLRNIYDNTLEAWKIFLGDWFPQHNIFALFLILLLINTVAIVLYFSYKTVKKNVLNKRLFAQYVFTFLYLFLGCTLGIYGMLAILDNAHMRPRTFISLGTTLSVLLFLPYSLGLCRNNYTSGSIAFISSIGAIAVLTFSMVWGNAMAAQDMYQNSVVWQLSQDIYSLKKDQGKIVFENGISFPPSINKVTVDKFPLLKRLLADRSHVWQGKKMALSIGLPFTGIQVAKTDDCYREKQPRLLDRLNYSIRDCDSHLIVSFK